MPVNYQGYVQLLTVMLRFGFRGQAFRCVHVQRLHDSKTSTEPRKIIRWKMIMQSEVFVHVKLTIGCGEMSIYIG